MSEKTSPFKRLFKIIKAEKQEVQSIVFFAIFQGLVSLSLPLGIQAIINYIQAGRVSTSWYVLVAFVLVGILISGILQLKQLSITETIEQRIFANTTFEFSIRIPRLSISGADGKYIPEVMNRFFEVVTLQKGIAKLLLDLSASVVQILFGLLVLALYHPLFIFLGLILIFILYLIFRITGAGGLKTSLTESKYKFEIAHWLQEMARAMTTFKLSGTSELPVQKTDELTRKYLGARLQHFLILMTQYKALIFFKLAVAASLIIGGSILVFSQQINIGQFVAAEIIVLLVISSVEKLILSMSTVYDVLTSLDKLESVHDMPLEREDGVELPEKESIQGLTVSVRNLKHEYPGTHLPLIEDVSFEVKSGETICVTGEPGSGKTTLLRLLAGMYEPTHGSISYNDFPLGNLHLDKFREMVGENFSGQVIFKGTLLENISCGIPGITLNQVKSASAISGLTDYVQSLPKGYETNLDPEGQRLAGSVARKIILARCFINNPKLLLIEDNFTDLSLADRQQILEVIFEQCRKTTSIIVSTDPEVMRRCDRVLTIQQGKIQNKKG
jgi:ABC-type bacteriocin/lantibiotic exporter with double-glycine peptidase domain